MAMEAVVFPQVSLGTPSRSGVPLAEDENGDAAGSSVQRNLPGNTNSSPRKAGKDAIEVVTRKKRQRSRCIVDTEMVESQRMTHIAVERNRRRQMNEYLAVLRSLMPSSYVQKGDQASIVAGAINYVRELEQLLRTLQAQRHLQQQPDTADAAAATAAFTEFFTFSQFSPYHSNARGSNSDTNSDMTVNQTLTDITSIEVTLVERHANLKLLSARRSKQLPKLVLGLQSLRLVPLHLNLSSVREMVMYCFNLKVEEACQCASAGELATAVKQMLGRMEEAEKFGLPQSECKQKNQ